MKLRCVLPLLLAVAIQSYGASAKSYQVTGPIVELTDTVITVQKGDEKWEIARTPTTKVEGTLAVGSRVTVHYKMAADRIEVKESSPKSERGAEKASPKAQQKTTK